jgi:hypothetical protein
MNALRSDFSHLIDGDWVAGSEWFDLTSSPA